MARYLKHCLHCSEPTVSKRLCAYHLHVQMYGKTTADLLKTVIRQVQECQQSRFQVLSRKTGQDLLGGPVSGDNAYITIYPTDIRHPDQVPDGVKTCHPSCLKPGESTLQAYHLSSEYVEVEIRRLDDAMPGSE